MGDKEYEPDRCTLSKPFQPKNFLIKTQEPAALKGLLTCNQLAILCVSQYIFYKTCISIHLNSTCAHDTSALLAQNWVYWYPTRDPECCQCTVVVASLQ